MLANIVAFAKSNPALEYAMRYHPLYYPQARAIARLPVEQQLQQQPALIRRTLKWAQRSRYGREFDSLKLSDWPLLGKDEVRQQGKDFLGGVMVPVPAKTSGSSGVPMSVWRSVQNLSAEQAFFDTLLEPYTKPFNKARIAILRGDTIKDPNDLNPPYALRRGNRLTLSFPHLNTDTFEWYRSELEQFRPDILWIYPTGGDFLASMYLQAGTTQKIPVVLSSSEMLTADAHQRLQSAFSATVINYYGQAERVCLAWQTKPDESWFVPAYGAVELRPSDSDAPEGMKAASVVATGLWNRAMPLVRYQTGDTILYPATYSDGDVQQIAEGRKPFTTLLGRESEYILTKDGARIQGMNHIPRGVRALRVQILQDSLESVEIRVHPAPGFDDSDAALLLSNARAKIPESVGITIHTDVPFHRTASHKTPFVVRSV